MGKNKLSWCIQRNYTNYKVANFGEYNAFSMDKMQINKKVLLSGMVIDE